MKKAYLSLVAVCLIPLLGLSVIVGDLAKAQPAPMSLGLSMLPQMGGNTQA
jgi:hypothetical protein